MEKVLELLRKGVEDESLKAPMKVFKKNPQTRELTKKFSPLTANASDLEHQFAILTSIKSDYREARPPKLVTGTLLKETRKTKKTTRTVYWVCIQPVCDCVRLNEVTSFPLLPLDPVDDKKPFDLVLPGEAGTYVRVKVANNPDRPGMKRFEPAKDGLKAVKAHFENGAYYFRASRGQRYQWIADLKFEHAQRIVNQYAATISRVGTEESEWLRRSAGRG